MPGPKLARTIRASRFTTRTRTLRQSQNAPIHGRNLYPIGRVQPKKRIGQKTAPQSNRFKTHDFKFVLSNIAPAIDRKSVFQSITHPVNPPSRPGTRGRYEATRTESTKRLIGIGAAKVAVGIVPKPHSSHCPRVVSNEIPFRPVKNTKTH